MSVARVRSWHRSQLHCQPSPCWASVLAPESFCSCSFSMLVFVTVPLGTPLVQQHAAVSTYIHVHCTHGKLANKKVKLLRYRVQCQQMSSFSNSRGLGTPAIARATSLISGNVTELYQGYIQFQIYRRKRHRQKLKDHFTSRQTRSKSMFGTGET